MLRVEFNNNVITKAKQPNKPIVSGLSFYLNRIPIAIGVKFRIC
jgi:hypothetical protein